MKILSILMLAAAVPAPALAQQSIAIASGGGRSNVSVTVPFGQTAQFNRWRLRPVRILEDSRCPRFVTCVWRGRLRVEFAVRGRAPIILDDGKPVPFGGGTLTLVGANPVSGRGEKIPSRAYRFQLRFER